MSIHYNELFTNTFRKLGYDVVYQPSCLINNYDQQCWPIQYPDVNWTDRTLVVMHCQDFVSIRNNTCPELEAIEQHFGDRAHRVVVIVWNIGLDKVYNGPLRLIHFPTHSYELLLNLREQKSQWIDNFNKPRTKIYQCLNGIPRRHRVQVVDHLQKHYDVIGKFISLGDRITLPEYDYSTYFGCENETNWHRLQYVYSNTSINIVTETQYSECPGIISEKTLFAFLAQQVPIVIGYKGIVDDCESLGFDMFRDIVDTSYDHQTDTSRWRNAIDFNKKLLCGKIDLDVNQRLEKNLQTVLELPDTFVKRFLNTVQENFPNLDTSEPS
jgi:hypothetical protein